MTETATPDREKIVITLKGGPGFEAPWVVVHAADTDESAALLGELAARGAFAAIQKMARDFQSSASASGPPLSGGDITDPAQTDNWPSGQPSSVPAMPVGSTPPCPDCGGPTRFKSGTKRDGTTWSGYMCVNKPQGARGHVIWL